MVMEEILRMIGFHPIIRKISSITMSWPHPSGLTHKLLLRQPHYLFLVELLLHLWC
jgi:hypothetical protein